MRQYHTKKLLSTKKMTKNDLKIDTIFSSWLSLSLQNRNLIGGVWVGRGEDIYVHGGGVGEENITCSIICEDDRLYKPVLE